MKIGFANDHRGYRLKNKLAKYLKMKGYDIVDFGTNTSQSVDYPEYAFQLGKAIVEKEIDYGIAICGSGIGISIACNKVKGVRCAKVDQISEAKACRYDNDANIIALNGRMPGYKAKDILDAFLNTKFSNIERHQRRIDQITDYEKPKRKKKITVVDTEEKENEC